MFVCFFGVVFKVKLENASDMLTMATAQDTSILSPILTAIPLYFERKDVNRDYFPDATLVCNFCMSIRGATGRFSPVVPLKLV